MTGRSGWTENVVQDLTPAKSRALGISVIYQQPALFPDLTVAENIALAKESGSLWRRIRWDERNAHAAELLSRVGCSIKPQTAVSKSEYAGAAACRNRQSARCGREGGDHGRTHRVSGRTGHAKPVPAIVNELRSNGCAVIYISHRFEELFALADRVTVLRDGESLGTFPMSANDRRIVDPADGGARIGNGFSQAQTTHSANAFWTCGM